MGDFTDKRDGRKYRTVEIDGFGFEWMAENLNYKISNSWCYNDDESYGSRYGRLYTWDAAKAACPEGWRLPTRQECGALMTKVGGLSVAGKKLKAKSGWADSGNGTDDIGFSALPGGCLLPPSMYINATYEGAWWTSDEHGTNCAYAFGTECDRDDMVIDLDRVRVSGYSVRCVRTLSKGEIHRKFFNFMAGPTY